MFEINDIIREEFLNLYQENEDGEPKEDYSDILSKVKSLTPAFYNTISKKGMSKFNEYINKYNADGNIAQAHSYIAGDFLVDIGNKLGLQGVQYDWKNRGDENPDTVYFNFDYWMETPDRRPVNFRASVHIDDKTHAVNPYLSTVELEDGDLDTIVELLKSNWDASREFSAKQASTKYKKFDRINQKDQYHWFSYTEDFNKKIWEKLERLKAKYPDEKDLGFIICSLYLVAVLKKAGIKPLPKPLDIQPDGRFMTQHNVKVTLTDGRLVYGYITAFSNSDKTKFDVYQLSSTVMILDNGWHYIFKPKEKDN